MEAFEEIKTLYKQLRETGLNRKGTNLYLICNISFKENISLIIYFRVHDVSIISFFISKYSSLGLYITRDVPKAIITLTESKLTIDKIHNINNTSSTQYGLKNIEVAQYHLDYTDVRLLIDE